ncbi:hypothetical protein ASE66_22750 [Bosea sp. Root483D1]|uniref:Bug family tripartite tricarboxylate transporter substrate binding protein n=1 Tax=Bosea sp. Root483D1 TaxID=1736544 RepID=UPI00070DDF38|nr:tripartite tricarboxylate transporter substrate-binding protein [Bosea sp. Root483D1]KRE13260.1 hypothetical protein ASE66_22750 [Bosea sp. Root483D1]
MMLSSAFPRLRSPDTGSRLAGRAGCLLSALLSLAAAFCSPAAAQSFPDHPVKLVVPFIAGGPVDALARIAAQDLSHRLGQAVVIENQSGAGGAIGTGAVAHASPDGHTLLFAISSQVYGLYPQGGQDFLKGFVPVATVAAWSHVLVTGLRTPARTLRELIAHAKANPGALTFGYGLNTPPQILGETLKSVAGVDIRSIPYRGGAQAIADMLGDRLDLNFGTTATLLPLIREGKLRALAYTGASRSPELPDVPTVAEAGYPQLAFDPDAWAMILAPADTPRPVVERLNQAVRDCLRSPQMLARLAALGYAARPGSPEETAAFLAAEVVKWPPIVKAAGIKAE